MQYNDKKGGVNMKNVFDYYDEMIRPKEEPVKSKDDSKMFEIENETGGDNSDELAKANERISQLEQMIEELKKGGVNNARDSESICE